MRICTNLLNVLICVPLSTMPCANSVGTCCKIRRIDAWRHVWCHPALKLWIKNVNLTTITWGKKSAKSTWISVCWKAIPYSFSKTYHFFRTQILIQVNKFLLWFILLCFHISHWRTYSGNLDFIIPRATLGKYSHTTRVLAAVFPYWLCLTSLHILYSGTYVLWE